MVLERFAGVGRSHLEERSCREFDVARKFGGTAANVAVERGDGLGGLDALDELHGRGFALSYWV